VELDLEIPAEDEERAAAALWACGGAGSWTIAPGLVRGYFAGGIEGVVPRFRAAWQEIAGEEWRAELHPRVRPARDWLERWRAAARPIAVTPTLWIVPPGRTPDPGPRAKVVVIQPGQGFGTGTHPTTQALLRWIEADPGERVLDVGCGSGVLAITALASGAALAIGLDVDRDAVANAVENRRRNAASRLHLVQGTLDALAPGARFDRVLANLDRKTFESLEDALLDRCAPGGRLGVAGLLVAERARFLDVPVARGFEIVEERTDEDAQAGGAWWSAWLAPRPGS
jgi:ribosomal protein L11 methyltransferase